MGNTFTTQTMLKELPPELQRLVARFIPRHQIAQLFHDMKDSLTLKYVRLFQFEQEWLTNELRPYLLGSIYYGRILRVKISQREELAMFQHPLEQPDRPLDYC
jgi:hypothetical protein